MCNLYNPCYVRSKAPKPHEKPVALRAQSATALRAFDESGPDNVPEQIRYWALKTSNPLVVRGLAHEVEGVIDWTLAA